MEDSTMQSAASGSRFLSLPTELQCMVLKRLPRFRDLASVCRVNRQLNGLAIPILYDSFGISQRRKRPVRKPQTHIDESTRTLAAMIGDGSNPGLKHIRALDISTCNECEESKAHYELVSKLIFQHLNPDQVQQINMMKAHDHPQCRATQFWTLEEFASLVRRFPHLLSIQLGSFSGDECSRSLTEKLVVELLPLLRDIKSLTLTVHHDETLMLSFAARLIKQNNGGVSALTFLGRRYSPDPAEWSLLTQRFVQYFATSSPGTPSLLSQISSLRLYSLDLQDQGHNLAQGLVDGKLEELHLTHCDGVAGLTNTLGPALGEAARPKLRKLVLLSSKDSELTRLAVERFLLTFQGLCEFSYRHLCMMAGLGVGLLKLESVLHHAATLRVIQSDCLVGIYPSKQQQDQIDLLRERCVRLEDLSLA